MTHHLLTFREVLEQFEDATKRPHLLLGNGFSCSVHAGFQYSSLFEMARNNGLPPVAVSMFERYGTTNFEAVMRLLEDADWISRQYGAFGGAASTPMFDDLQLVRQALIQSISQTHPPHSFALTKEQKSSCCTFLEHFHDVFSLNYDLLLYWVLLGEGKRRVDGFGFPSSDTENPPYLVLSQPRDAKPWLFHLHGALHLYLADGETRKHRYQYQQRPLLDVICEGIQKSEYPLFVAEGSARQKMTHIRSNMYLSLCFQELVRSSNDFVCYGMSFGDSDTHIADAIADNDNICRLFVGLYGDWESEANLKVRAAARRIQQRRLQLRNKKNDLVIQFFDSESAGVWTPQPSDDNWIDDL